MAYTARVIPVFLASPDGMDHERSIVRDAIQKWNAMYSKSRCVMLTGVGWDTHGSAHMKGHPQNIINDVDLSDCDLLVALFGTKLGSPTENADSGTVEEIETHLRAKKAAVLFFSRISVDPTTLDSVEFKRVQEFENDCKNKGRLENFTSHGDLESKIYKALEYTMINDIYIKSLIKCIPNDSAPVEPSTHLATDTEKHPIIGISRDAYRMLVAATNGKGSIKVSSELGGTRYYSGSEQYGGEGPEDLARWDHAFDQLVDEGYIQDRSGNGSVFRVTHPGFELAKTDTERRTDNHTTPTLSKKTLSSDAIELLVAVGNPDDSDTFLGYIIRPEPIGRTLNAGNFDFPAFNSSREYARWESAIQELVDDQLVKQESKGCYSYTHSGFQAASKYYAEADPSNPCPSATVYEPESNDPSLSDDARELLKAIGGSTSGSADCRVHQSGCTTRIGADLHGDQTPIEINRWTVALDELQKIGFVSQKPKMKSSWIHDNPEVRTWTVKLQNEGFQWLRSAP